ncbi:hypothetical protein H0E87_024938 [Populus deltoides]|uniref:Uncharacterized protein n=1 Tax=Populus deltoides TaxID=3696 RepID=A0A8T2XAT5_POPDE|nr:hypothetical protein H0E87_024938 [Populus deltoides]
MGNVLTGTETTGNYTELLAYAYHLDLGDICLFLQIWCYACTAWECGLVTTHANNCNCSSVTDCPVQMENQQLNVAVYPPCPVSHLKLVLKGSQLIASVDLSVETYLVSVLPIEMSVNLPCGNILPCMYMISGNTSGFCPKCVGACDLRHLYRGNNNQMPSHS